MSHIGIMSDIILYFKGFQAIIMCVVIPMCDIIAYFCVKRKETAVFLRFPLKNPLFYGEFMKNKGFESVCKPSSVVYGHLSRLAVADKLKRCSRYSVGRTALLTDTQSCCGWGLHGIPCYHDIGELLPRLSILTANGQPINEHSKPKG